MIMCLIRTKRVTERGQAQRQTEIDRVRQTDRQTKRQAETGRDTGGADLC